MSVKDKKPIKQLIEKLLDYNPVKIILFGSYARGDADKYSDIDIVVIKETNRRFLDRLKDTIPYTKISKTVDILVYTPSEYENMLETGNGFIQKVEQEGIIIYERERS